MKIFLIGTQILVVTSLCFGQYHDPTLDTIAGGVAQVNLSVQNQANNTNGLTIQQIQQNELDVQINLKTDFTNNTIGLVTNSGAGLGTNLTKFFTSFKDVTNQNSYAFTTEDYYEGNLGNAYYVHYIIPVYGGFDQDFSVGGVNRFMGGTFLTDSGTAVRDFIIAIVWAIYFYAGMGVVKKEITNTMGQRQISGVSQTIFGTSLSTPTALIYAGILTVLFASTITFVISNGLMVDVKTYVAGLGSNYASLWWNGFFPISILQALTEFMPLGHILFAWLSYCAFEYFLCAPLFLAIRSIIFWLIR